MLSIIIVHYKTPELLNKCLASIFTSITSELVEVIVVDNDSKDNSKELVLQVFPLVKWIDSGYNAGFARANNSGIRSAKGEYILLLNPDAYVKQKALITLLECYKKLDVNNNLGLLTCRVLSSIDNNLQVGSGTEFPGFKKYLRANPIFIKFFPNKATRPYDAPKMHYINHEIDFASGGCVMIKKSKILENDLFLDEDFFLYSEDVEWSFRVKKKGFFNYFCADVEVFHVNSASTGQSKNKKKIMFVSELLYLYKTHTKLQFWLFQLLFRFNFLLNKWLLTRSGELDKLEMEKMYKSIFDKYLPRIKKGYKRIPSSAKEYVSYVETH